MKFEQDKLLKIYCNFNYEKQIPFYMNFTHFTNFLG